MIGNTTFKLRVWGELACFTRPEMKTERVSYDVMTASAARGILEAIYWKPQFNWIILSIKVIKPIQFTTIRRNEVDAIASKPSAAYLKGDNQNSLGIYIEDCRQQRASTILRDVEYIIEASIEPIEAEPVPTNKYDAFIKHREIFRRRASKGQCFQQPYFGTREFPAYFELLNGEEPACAKFLMGTKDLGFMLQDMVYTSSRRGTIIESNQGKRVNANPVIFRASMVDGRIMIPTLPDNKVKK